MFQEQVLFLIFSVSSNGESPSKAIMALHLCTPGPIGLHALVTSKPVPKEKILSPNWMEESRDIYHLLSFPPCLSPPQPRLAEGSGFVL